MTDAMTSTDLQEAMGEILAALAGVARSVSSGGANRVDGHMKSIEERLAPD